MFSTSWKCSLKLRLVKKLDHALLAELLERGQLISVVANIIIIFSGRKWNCRLELKRPARFAAIVIENKDNRVESTYDEQRC